MTRMVLPKRAVNAARYGVISTKRFPDAVGFSFKRTIRVGKTRKVSMKDSATPTIIIRPKLIIGGMSLLTKDPKATIVVRLV